MAILYHIYEEGNDSLDQGYIGITERTFSERFKEHCRPSSNIYEHIEYCNSRNSLRFKIVLEGSKWFVRELERSLRPKWYIGWNGAPGGGGWTSECNKHLMKRYEELTGYSNPFKNPKVKEKIKDTNRKLRGVDYASQCPKSKKKACNTNLKVRGVHYPMQCKKTRLKSIDTVKRVWGVDNISKNPSIKERKKQTRMSSSYEYYKNKYKEYNNKKLIFKNRKGEIVWSGILMDLSILNKGVFKYSSHDRYKFINLIVNKHKNGINNFRKNYIDYTFEFIENKTQ